MCLSVDTSPDHRHFVVGCSDSKVLLWDLGMQKFIRSYDQHKDQVWGVSYNKQDSVGRKFASVGDDYLLQVYEWNREYTESLMFSNIYYYIVYYNIC